MILSRQQVVATGIASAALAAVGLAIANFLGEGENGGAGAYAVTLAGSIVVAAVLFGWAMPRTERPARAGLVSAAFALLSLPVFWTGLPYVLGPAVVVYGLMGRSRRGGGRAAVVAVAAGTLATSPAIAGLVWDALA